jgi:hypothetical protein
LKHYNELMDVETVSIDLDVLVSTVRLVAYGAPNANTHDLEYALHNVTDQMDALSKRLRDTFDVLFNSIRDEEDKNDEAKAKKAKSKKDSF